jgi:hypothetical protein
MMNKNITQLWEQAAQRDDIMNTERYEKFAELIVLECADFVAQNTLEDQGMWGKIVRHFGVEE